MADGPAYWERLIAASDLYHMHRVEQIYVLEELQSSGYNFVRRANDTRVQRAIDFLSDRGVPLDVIRTVPLHQATWFSSYDEAVGVSNLPRQFESVVVVTSAPHTRRSTLCFHRVFDSRATIATFAATPADGSVETHWPIWIEYVKLAVYWLAV
ncbi:hypothetical protein CGZ80_19295 [Rhodopirellula sp. MGV]|nr:hypothetical protein CGZ80_19295 [Rhodopirellula sp. MGV]PNY35564.1 YdcF family protein [Rhodopirellula baltica]